MCISYRYGLESFLDYLFNTMVNKAVHRDRMEIVNHETRLVSPEKVYITYVHF